MAKRSKPTAKQLADAKRFDELRAKANWHYVGFNVIRTQFNSEADAREYLHLMGELDRLYPFSMYGGGDQWPRILPGANGTFEVYAG